MSHLLYCWRVFDKIMSHMSSSGSFTYCARLTQRCGISILDSRKKKHSTKMKFCTFALRFRFRLGFKLKIGPMSKLLEYLTTFPKATLKQLGETLSFGYYSNRLIFERCTKVPWLLCFKNFDLKKKTYFLLHIQYHNAFWLCWYYQKAVGFQRTQAYTDVEVSM